MRLKQLGKDANANAADEIPPVLYLSETEEDWINIGNQYAFEPLLKDQADLEATMESTLDEMNKLKHKNGMIEVSRGVQKSPIKKPKDLVSKINNLERDL